LKTRYLVWNKEIEIIFLSRKNSKLFQKQMQIVTCDKLVNVLKERGEEKEHKIKDNQNYTMPRL